MTTDRRRMLAVLIAILLHSVNGWAQWKETPLLQGGADPLAILDFSRCLCRLRFEGGAEGEGRYFMLTSALRKKQKQGALESQTLEFPLSFSDLDLFSRSGVLSEDAKSEIEREARCGTLRVIAVLGTTTWTHRMNAAYSARRGGLETRLVPLAAERFVLETYCAGPPS